MVKLRVNNLLLILVLIFSFATPSLLWACANAEVIRVTDGDTIVAMCNGVETKIRLHGIDCPELKQPYGEEAKQFATDLTLGKVVDVHEMDQDRYGRVVAVVELPDDSILINELVRAGLAWWYRKYAPDDEVLEDLEQGTKAEKVGLWRDDEPIAPWEWRKPKRKGQ